MRPTKFANGGGTMLAGLPAATAGTALALALAAGNDPLTELNDGAAVAQLCGTDSTPSVVARPRPALTAALLRPGELNALEPLPNADPSAWNWLPNAVTAGVIDLVNVLAEPSIETPEVPSDADEPAPDATLVPDVSTADDVVTPVNDVVVVVDADNGVVVEAADASPDAALGAAAALSGVVDTVVPSGIDIAEVNGETVCAAVPAPVAAACATAPA